MILTFYITIVLIIIAYLLIESIFLNFRLSKTPVRILINGTRGKTTTVKILHQLFSHSEYIAIAKTTGNYPLIHFSSGKSKKLNRTGPANILENVRQLIQWSEKNLQVVIFEDMALQPEMQSVLSIKYFVRPTLLFQIL